MIRGDFCDPNGPPPTPPRSYFSWPALPLPGRGSAPPTRASTSPPSPSAAAPIGRLAPVRPSGAGLEGGEGGAGGQVKERGWRRRKVTAGRAGGRGEAAQNEPRNHGRTAGRTDGACGRPGSSPGYGAPAAAMEQRLRALEQLVRGEAGGSLGLDGLLDLLLGVHHELSSAPLRRERNVAQFLSWGEW